MLALSNAMAYAPEPEEIAITEESLPPNETKPSDAQEQLEASPAPSPPQPK
jgi:hypothetical protein